MTPDHCLDLIDCSLHHGQASLKISSKSVDNLLSTVSKLYKRQTDRKTDKCMGGGNKQKHPMKLIITLAKEVMF